MRDEKRRRIIMWIAVVMAVMLLIGAVAWMWERSYYKDQPFTFSQLVFLLLLVPAAVLLLVMFLEPAKKQSRAGDQVIATFSDAFTTVVVPWQGRPVSVVRAPMVPLDQMKGEGNDFTPAETVINVEIVDGKDQHTIVTDFDPAIEVEFKFPGTLIEKASQLAARQEIKIATADDLTSVIQIGFWDGARWVLFTKAKHNYRIQGNASTGYVGKVDLKKWGDPPIGWNPPS